MNEVSQGGHPVYVRVPPFKVFIMCFFTFGIYIYWWMYRNWKSYAAQNGKDIWTVIGTIFLSFSLLSII